MSEFQPLENPVFYFMFESFGTGWFNRTMQELKKIDFGR